MDFTTRHLVMIQGQQQAAAVLPIQAAATTNGSLSSAPNIFSYRDKLWFVPEHFQFPKPPNLSLALGHWLKGSAVGGGKVIRPYRQLKTDCLPNRELRQQLKNPWKQFFTFIDGVELDGATWNSDWPRDLTQLTDQQYESAEKKMWAILEDRVSYGFKDKRKAKANSFSTWAKKILPSEIAKHGTAADISFLSGIQIASRNRELKDAPKYPQRQKQRQRKQQRLNSSKFSMAANTKRTEQHVAKFPIL